METFHANGKLLLTAEYLVMDGALALVLPLKYGQSLRVKSKNSKINRIDWKASEKDILWFQCELDKEKLTTISTSNSSISSRVVKILRVIYRLKPELFSDTGSLEFEFCLDYNRFWGWGSSSTLINLLSQWAKIDAFDLFFSLFNGSGFDVAASFTNQPFLYKTNQPKPDIETVSMNLTFRENIFFVYLGKKQDSSKEIEEYRKQYKADGQLIKRISEISQDVTLSKNLSQFEDLMREHEQLLAVYLKRSSVQSAMFSDYSDGVVKSLGAWGGDFVMMTCSHGKKIPEEYLRNKSLSICFAYEEIVKNAPNSIE